MTEFFESGTSLEELWELFVGIKDHKNQHNDKTYFGLPQCLIR